MTKNLRVTLAQLNFIVGDIFGNCEKIITAINQVRNERQTDLIVFPELAISGYPPEDLLYRKDFYVQVNLAIDKICEYAKDIEVLIGYPECTNEGYFNSAVWIRNGKRLANYQKQKLPNYGVFDELRYFKSGKKSCVVKIKGIKCAVLICEDIWYEDTVLKAKSDGAQCIICINGSPYSIYKDELRKNILKDRINAVELPIFYLNLIGGQDELVFDGCSFVMNQEGEVCAQAACFQEDLFTVEINAALQVIKQSVSPRPKKIESIYQALCLGVRDYVTKNGFPGVIIGLSGGIDSALTLCVAADALGADKVTALLMPSQYTADMSVEDAKKQAEALGVNYHVIPIDKLFDEFINTLHPLFADLPKDTTEENIQARIRGILLMAVSNKSGKIVLSTGNKSEMAVGYSTLYGDMVGGFCVLKDIFKTIAYKLADYRNSLSSVIPHRVIDRPPSAELAPDQLDQDSLPQYEILDAILIRFVEEDHSIEEIIKEGFDREIVNQVVCMVQRNEYKRRQAPPGVRISEKSFGKDRRYPITSRYKCGLYGID